MTATWGTRCGAPYGPGPGPTSSWPLRQRGLCPACGASGGMQCARQRESAARALAGWDLRWAQRKARGSVVGS